MSRLTSWVNHAANLAWSVAPGAGEAVPAPGQVRLVAHRGAHGPGGEVENSLAAIRRCMALGAWGVEVDIRLTADGEPVIHHDPDGGRLWGRPDIVIADTAFDRLRQQLPEVPHLEEVLECAAGKVHLMLEIKESWRERPTVPARVSRALANLEPGADFHLLSLVPDHLEGFADIPRAAFVDVAWMNATEIIRANLALGHGAVAGSFLLFGRRRLQQLRDAGRRVGTGFLENPRALRREVWRGADWLFTDRVVALQSYLNGLEHGRELR